MKECPKCRGAGWLWWHELEQYDGPALKGQPDDTKYECEECFGHLEPLYEHTELELDGSPLERWADGIEQDPIKHRRRNRAIPARKR